MLTARRIVVFLEIGVWEEKLILSPLLALPKSRKGHLFGKRSVPGPFCDDGIYIEGSVVHLVGWRAIRFDLHNLVLTRVSPRMSHGGGSAGWGSV